MSYTMTVYAAHITSDIDFGLNLAHKTEVRHYLSLKSMRQKQKPFPITCGFSLYRAHGRSVYLYSDRVFDQPEQGQPWCYEVKDVIRFYWYSGSSDIFYTVSSDKDKTQLGFWFIHLFLPLYFTLEGKYDIFHGGAVEVAGKSIMFAAPSMGGKSTMTDFFLQKGHTLISDDKIATFVEEDRLMLVGSHPYHRPYRSFEDLGLRAEHFIEKIKPLHHIYLLEKTDSDASLRIEEVTGFAKFHALFPHYLFAFAFLKQHRMAYLADTANRTRVFCLYRPWSMDRIEEVYQAVCSHVKEGVK